MFLPDRATPRTNEIISTDHFRNKKCFSMAFHLRGKEEQWVWESGASWGADHRAFRIPWWADCSSHSAKCSSDYRLQPPVGRLRCRHLGPGIQIQTVKKNKVWLTRFLWNCPSPGCFLTLPMFYILVYKRPLTSTPSSSFNTDRSSRSPDWPQTYYIPEDDPQLLTTCVHFLNVAFWHATTLLFNLL